MKWGFVQMWVGFCPVGFCPVGFVSVGFCPVGFCLYTQLIINIVLTLLYNLWHDVLHLLLNNKLMTIIMDLIYRG